MIKANVPMSIEGMNLTKDIHGRSMSGEVRLCGLDAPVKFGADIAEQLWRDPYERAPMRLIVLAGAEANVVTELTARAEKAERERDDYARRMESILTTSNLIADLRTKAEDRAESAEHKAAMLEAEVGQANARLEQERKNVSAMFDAKNKWADRAIAYEKELADAREQLAKVEWKGRITDAGALISNGCLLCDGANPSDSGARRLPEHKRGHRPACWYARQGKADKEQARIPIKYVHIHAPNGPIGTAVGVREESSPAPKFKVRQKVRTRAGYDFVVRAHKWVGGWIYQDNRDCWFSEELLGPAPEFVPSPKFAVGEWVTHNAGASEVMSVEREGDLWKYGLSGNLSAYEQALTAQTPQYKHDCAGCVFLGRWTSPGWASCDLYVCKNGKNAVWRYGDGSESWIARGLDNVGPVIPEIRRRAVARGLVQG